MITFFARCVHAMANTIFDFDDEQENIKAMSKEKRIKIFEVINTSTGEVELRKKIIDKTFGKQEWFAMFQDYALTIAHSNLTGEQFRVLFYLFNKLNFDNYIRVKQKDIVNELNIKRQNVSRSIKTLKEKDIIYEDPTDKGVYILNPHIGHKGTKNYQSNILQYTKLKTAKLLEKK